MPDVVARERERGRQEGHDAPDPFVASVHPDYRELLLGNYRLLYRVYADRVEIAALLHGRREFRAAWRSRD